jgi:hypothetical protein
LVDDLIYRTSSFEPLGMTRSIYWSRANSCGMTSRVVTSWIAVLGTCVDSRASEITFDIAIKDSVDSFPPRRRLVDEFYMAKHSLTF